MAERSRPGATAPAAATPDTNGKAPKAKAKYHLYEVGEGDVLSPVGVYEGRFAEQAVGAFIASPGDHAELAEKVSKGDAKVAVVPDRNLTIVTATVETKTRVKLSAA